jgi:hypothetical protein
MNTLILHPTDTSQWHALVYDAQAKTSLVLAESMESYLVFLLMRFSQSPELLGSILSMDFLEALNLSGTQRTEHLQAVGDKSLLLCGLFPELANKRRVGLEYFSDMGQAAYLTAGELHNHQLSDLYLQLGEKFPLMQTVLQAMRR